jgi:serine protease Do
MRRNLALAALCAVLIVSCATAPQGPAPAPLPAVRLKELQELYTAGSYLQTIGAIDAIRRQRVDLAASDLDSLEAKAIESLSAALKKAVESKSYDEALRLLDSAQSLGKPEIAGSVNRKSLLERLAASQDSSGDKVLALLTRIRILSAGEPAEGDFDAALTAAEALDNRAAIRSLAAAMKPRGFPLPAAAAALVTTGPSFPRMISGTVTIMVNRGIKVENGVGYPDRVIGSGFFIDKRGYILTNHHVIESEVDPKYEGYSRLYIRLSESPAGERIPAKVVGYDKIFDLALIKAEVTPEYTFSGSFDQVVAPGDRIFAIGSPAGLEKTITAGIISAMGRRLLQVGDSLQVDVPLNPGNSGGPLLDEKGDLIGVCFAGFQQFTGLNFAIPYTWVEKALPALYRGGQAVHSWLGVAVAETDKGLEVVYTVPNEPAALAGLRTGDILESVDGVSYTKLQDAQEAILRHTPPSLVQMTVRRGESRIQALVCLAQRPDSPIEVSLKRDARDNVLYPLFGMQLEKTGSFFWRDNYIVKRVTRGSVADESGISVDDPLSIQDWRVDADKGYALLQIVIKKKRAGFIESAIQIASYLDKENFM